MFALFIATFVIGMVFSIISFFTLSEDIKTKSRRPVFILIFALIGWFSTMPALAITTSQTTVYPAFSINTGTQTITIPAYNAITTNQPMNAQTINLYEPIWFAILFLHFAILILYLLDIGEGNIKEAFRLIRGRS